MLIPSKSKWSSPVYIKPLSSNSSDLSDSEIGTKISVDFSELNKITERYNEELPSVNQILDGIKPSCYYSRFSILCGVHQFRLNKESSDKTAFWTGNLIYFTFLLIFNKSFLLQLKISANFNSQPYSTRLEIQPSSCT